MALTYSEAPHFGMKAPEFTLLSTDERKVSLRDFKDTKALVIIFMCNHCPYVVATEDRINDLARDYTNRGVKLIGINSNDPIRYPDDNFENMKKRATEKKFVFPYLFDPTQEVAKNFRAACTPDPYVFENVSGDFLLRYHGRIDDNWKDPSSVKTRDLANAIEAIIAGRDVNPDQKPAMGCSIKWKL